ncbi:MAG: ABC transporter permease [Intestinimonas sp.]|jgi:oligopeptide transport system permease protein|nr:ABC transporter permease [Intestinimonas sp.]
MAKYIIKRLGSAVISLFIITACIFLLLRLMPIEGYLGAGYEKMSPEVVQNQLRSLGLLDPVWVQLKNFYVNLFHGNLGISWIYRPNVPITDILAAKIPISISMGAAAMALALVVGLPLGVVMSRFKGGLPDKLGTSFIVLLNAVPVVVFYLIIQLYGSKIFGVPMLFSKTDWRTWILPTVCLSIGSIANYAMWMRRYMVDELNSDYVRLAMAKGVSRRNIMYHHVFRNAFVPMIQLLPASLLMTIMGSIYVESLFSVPGMGGLLVDVIKRQDNTMVQALVLIFATMGILGLLLGDLLMALADPRIKLTRGEDGR